MQINNSYIDGGGYMAEKLFIAHTPEEAVRAKAEGNAFLAGGTEILHLDSPLSADSYVSVRRIPAMRETSTESGIISIGASCTFQELIDNEAVPGYLKDALHFMASRTRRNMATIGGNIAAGRDDSFLIPTLIAASAVLDLCGADGRSEKVFAEDFIFNRDKYADMLITCVSVPSGNISIKSARSANTAQSHARLTVSLSYDEGKYRAVAAVKNSGIYALDSIADALSRSALSEDEIVGLVKADSSIALEDDLIYGSADYRKYLLGITLALMYAELNEKGGRA
jgi:putative selenate reductase FAD-binding subunit